MPLKILTIDDNPGMTELLGLMLRGFGLDVRSANNSELALQMVRKEKRILLRLIL